MKGRSYLLPGVDHSESAGADDVDEKAAVGRGLALRDLHLASDPLQLVATVDGRQAKSAGALQAAPYEQTVTGLENVQAHLLSCRNLCSLSIVALCVGN